MARYWHFCLNGLFHLLLGNGGHAAIWTQPTPEQLLSSFLLCRLHFLLAAEQNSIVIVCKCGIHRGTTWPVGLWGSILWQSDMVFSDHCNLTAACYKQPKQPIHPIPMPSHDNPNNNYQHQYSQNMPKHSNSYQHNQTQRGVVVPPKLPPVVTRNMNDAWILAAARSAARRATARAMLRRLFSPAGNLMACGAGHVTNCNVLQQVESDWISLLQHFSQHSLHMFIVVY